MLSLRRIARLSSWCARASRSAERGENERASLFLDPLQVSGSTKALGVELVHFLRTRRARREPALVVTTFKPPMGSPLPGAVVTID